MKSQYLLSFLLLWLLATPAFAGAPLPIPDPEKFSEEIMTALAENRTPDAAAKISEIIGLPEQKTTLENTLKFAANKKFEFRKKVIDREIAGALRQVVHYTFIKDIGFVYFRFNYKQTGSGWILAHFTFASETNELFPPAMNLE
jgi:hypothetical protein